MFKFGFGKEKARAKALEGALEEEVSGRIREKALNADAQEALALLAQEHKEDAQQAKQESERLRELSTKDELTGVLNRRGFMEEITRITSAIAPKGPVKEQRKQGFETLTLLLLDIDFFKKYNDTLGHPAGDDILQKVARHLSSKLNMRATDFVGRYGGEEFVIAFPSASEQDVLRKLAEIRSSVGEAGKTGIKFTEYINGIPIVVTMSCGISEYKPGEDISATIDRADKALYFAKRGGRDQAHIYDPATMSKMGHGTEEEPAKG